MPKKGNKKMNHIRGGWGEGAFPDQMMFGQQPGMFGQPGIVAQGTSKPQVLGSDRDIINDPSNNTIRGWLWNQIKLIALYISNYAKAVAMYEDLSKYIETNPEETVSSDLIQNKAGQTGQTPQPGMNPPVANIAPVKMENGKMVQTQLKKEVSIGQISKSSWTYYGLLIMVILVFIVLPFVIFVLALVYSFPVWSLQHFINKGRFFGDLENYREMQSIVNLFGIYINDYVLGMWVVCIVYLILVISMYFTEYINRKIPEFKTNVAKIYLLLGICIAALSLYSVFNHNKVQRLGQLRDSFNNTVYNYISMDYIEYLDRINKEECQACGNKDAWKGTFQTVLGKGSQATKACPQCTTNDILKVNSIANYIAYILKIQNEAESIVAPSSISKMSFSSFKDLKNKDGKTYYSLILSATVTYQVLLKLKNNLYDQFNGTIINKNFFNNKYSLLTTVSVDKCTLMDIDYNLCTLRKIIGNDNSKDESYSEQLCKDVNNINTEINNIILDIKNNLNKVPFPLRLGLSSIVTIVCLFYYGSFIMDMKPLTTVQTNLYGINGNGYGNDYGLNGMYGMNDYAYR